MLELRSKVLQGAEEWQGQLKEWCSLNTDGTIPSRGWMWQFLASKALGVALLWLQECLSTLLATEVLSLGHHSLQQAGKWERRPERKLSSHQIWDAGETGRGFDGKAVKS